MPDYPAICAALVTPVEASGEIASLRLIAHALWVLGNGCDGVTLFGTTGEAPSFSVSERQATLAALLAAGIPCGRIIVGTGCCSVAETLALSCHAARLGVRAVLVHPPYFFPNPDDDGIVAFYAEVLAGLAGTDLGIILYHFPDMTNAPITHGIVARLLEAYGERILGLKDSTGSLDSMNGFAAAFPGLRVYSGDDHLLGPLLDAGGFGAITATANLAPNLLDDIRNGWQTGSEASITAQSAMAGLWAETLLKFSVTEAVKTVLAHVSGDPGWVAVRPPLKSLSDDDRARLLSMVEPYVPFLPKGLGLSQGENA